MALECGGQAGSADSDDGRIVSMIQDGDSVATLMRMADEHRPQCEREAPAAGEAAEVPAYTPAERFAKQRRLQAFRARLAGVEQRAGAGRVSVVRGGRRRC